MIRCYGRSAGVEPASCGYKPHALPLSYATMESLAGVEPAKPGLQPGAFPFSQSDMMADVQGIEPWHDVRGSGLANQPITTLAHIQYGAGHEIRTHCLSFTKRLHILMCLTGLRWRKSRDSNPSIRRFGGVQSRCITTLPLFQCASCRCRSHCRSLWRRSSLPRELARL